MLEEEYGLLAGARIRFYHPDDYTQAKALEARVQPYRPGDEAAVKAMFERARRAKEFGGRWTPQRSSEPDPESVEYAAEAYLAYWVAVLLPDAGVERVVGLVGVDRVDADPTRRL